MYFVHFKCCFRRIQDYPNISQYERRIYKHKEIQRDIPFEYTRWHYYQDHRSCNPPGIVAPLGPYVWDDLEKPHDRGGIDFAEYHNLSET
jgi:putative glutathione S-transferase